MSEDVILAVVAKADRSKYDTSATGILALKAAGVSDNVIKAMLGLNASPAPASAGAPARGQAAPVAPVGPAVQHIAVSNEQTSTQSVAGIEAGIYVEAAKGPIQLEPAVFSGQKTGGKFLHSVTTLFKSSIKAVVRSSQASQRIPTATPVFNFYFENRGAGLSNTGGGTFTGFMNGASSPNEFVLVRMKVDKTERSIVTGESWTFSDSNGVKSKDTIEFNIEKTGTGVYKVTPKAPLAPGEYCFFYAAGNLDKGGNGKLFDFGVDPGAAGQ
jgi:hypothetical protein